MKRKVYIAQAVEATDDSNVRTVKNKNIDGISNMCIDIIQQLYENLEDYPRDVPVFFGSAYTSLKSLHEFNRISEFEGALHVNPSLFPNTVLNSPSCQAGIYHKIQSPIYNISNGKNSTLSALELAYLYIANGETEHAIVCSAEESSDFANQIEGESITSSCGAIYLTSNHNDTKLIKILHENEKKTNDDSNVSSVQFMLQLVNLIHEQQKKNEITFKSDQGTTVIQIGDEEI